jgi:hypothetical protein
MKRGRPRCCFPPGFARLEAFLAGVSSSARFSHFSFVPNCGVCSPSAGYDVDPVCDSTRLGLGQLLLRLSRKWHVIAESAPMTIATQDAEM